MEMTSFTPKAFLLDTNQKSKFSFHYLIRTQGLRALAIRASNPQNTLIQISFHSPKCLPCPNHSLIMIMHAVTMAGQLAISLKTSSSCSSHTPLNHGQLWVFFLSFLLQPLSELRKYTSIFWQRITSHIQTYQRNTHWSKTINLKRHRACGRPRIITSMKNSSLRPYTPRNHNRGWGSHYCLPFCQAQCCTSAPIYWTILNIKLCINRNGQ